MGENEKEMQKQKVIQMAKQKRKEKYWNAD